MTDEQQAPPTVGMTCHGCGNPLEVSGTCDAGCAPATQEAQPAGRT